MGRGRMEVRESEEEYSGVFVVALGEIATRHKSVSVERVPSTGCSTDASAIHSPSHPKSTITTLASATSLPNRKRSTENNIPSNSYSHKPSDASQYTP